MSDLEPVRDSFEAVVYDLCPLESLLEFQVHFVTM